jgi:hypothetical protein
MDDLVAAAELRVLAGDGVEGVRAGRDDLRHPGVVERGNVLPGEHLVDELAAETVSFARSSSASAQPTQNRYSTSAGIVPSMTGTSK